MPRFNFNEITKSGKADIDLIGQNFEEIEEKALALSDIIDDLTTDDATKVLSAKQGKVLNERLMEHKLKGDFAVITGNRDVAAFAIDQDFINYPKGFNKDNTIVLSTMEEILNSQYYNTIACYDRGDNFTISENAVGVTLMPDTIRVRLNNYDNSLEKTFNYKIVLMKIS